MIHAKRALLLFWLMLLGVTLDDVSSVAVLVWMGAVTFGCIVLNLVHVEEE